MCEGQQQQQQQGNEYLSLAMLSAFSQIANIPKEKLKLKTNAIAGVGENSYGLVMQVNVKSIDTDDYEHNYILKIAPKNPARRIHMRVAEFYAREVFMYKDVFGAYRNLLLDGKNNCIDAIMPQMLYYSLDESNEFIIFEDLLKCNYIGGQRTQLPDYSMVAMAMRTLAKFHGLSFALQSKATKDFQALIAQLQPDNLFSPNIPQITIDYGKSYIRRARNMILMDDKSSYDARCIENALKNVEKNFKCICLHCVNGGSCVPYAVICHGDFWNNNILYKYDEDSKTALSAKLVDFQMSRYASPVLDLLHYLFVCTSHDLRKLHFENFLNDIYYGTLTEQLQEFELNVSTIYPRKIFERQLHEYCVYGFCMAALSLPIFVADATELLDMDKVSEAVQKISGDQHPTSSKNETSDRDDDDDDKELNNDFNLKLIEESFNLLTVRTAEIFKQRMIGIIEDIIKYNIKTTFEADKLTA